MYKKKYRRKFTLWRTENVFFSCHLFLYKNCRWNLYILKNFWPNLCVFFNFNNHCPRKLKIYVTPYKIYKWGHEYVIQGHLFGNICLYLALYLSGTSYKSLNSVRLIPSDNLLFTPTNRLNPLQLWGLKQFGFLAYSGSWTVSIWPKQCWEIEMWKLAFATWNRASPVIQSVQTVGWPTFKFSS